jgi:oxalate decarboxylase/phosphoglucose isomerase-like protein (cupin superfamily)
MSEVSDRVAANILFENDRVRVWDDRADPGETKQLHVHRRPYITVIITGEQGETVGEDGTVQRHFDGLAPGDALYVGPDELPAVHAMSNTGSTELVVLIIELLT